MKDTQQRIADECDAIKALLLEKNRAYGDSVVTPVGIFAKGLTPEAALLVRIDDKLNRLKCGDAAGEDVVLDLIGYLVMLRVVRAVAAK